MPDARDRSIQFVGQQTPGYIYDDFRDNPPNLVERDKAIPPADSLKAPYRIMRPVYEVTFGSATIQNSQLEIASGGARCIVPTHIQDGTWEADIAFNSLPTQGATALIVSRYGGNGNWKVAYLYDGTVELRDDGTGVTAISSSESIDTNTHSIRLTAENGVFELFWDGTSLGTYDYVSNPGKSLYSSDFFYSGIETDADGSGQPDVQVNVERLQHYPWVE